MLEFRVVSTSTTIKIVGVTPTPTPIFENSDSVKVRVGKVDSTYVSPVTIKSTTFRTLR